jgi:hypothetical protein
MADPTSPDIGTMWFSDALYPALTAGIYQIDAQVTADLNQQGNVIPEMQTTGWMDRSVSPYRLDPTLVAGVFPPQNSQGAFDTSLPMIVLSDPMLPWDRPWNSQDGVTGLPWLALLVFEDSESQSYTITPNATPPGPAAGAPGYSATATSDVIAVEQSLLADIMPSQQDLPLLSHVRFVNVTNCQAAAASGTGAYAVVVSNRVPRGGHQYLACLVSVENSPDSVVPYQAYQRPQPDGAKPWPQLTLLYSWTFSCAAGGTFQQLAQALAGTAARFGTGPGDWADTGHLPMQLTDETGSPQTAWYRGPLVPYPLARNPAGPYQCADQARTVSPETNREDISYAAAFEIGRLLAAADPRLAVDLARWRRTAYAQQARADVINNLLTRLGKPTLPGLPADPGQWQQAMVGATAAAYMTGRAASGIGPEADPWGLKMISNVPGLNPDQLAATWNLSGTDEASGLLGRQAGSLGVSAVPGGVTAGSEVETIGQLADRPDLLGAISQERSQALASTQTITGEKA